MKLRFTLLLVALGLAAGPAPAIQPVTWTHTTEADFAEGETDHTVVTNLGDVKLATGSRVLGEAPENLTVLYDIEKLADAVYVAAGPRGTLLRLEDDALVEVAAMEGEQIFALDQKDGELIVAVSAPEASRLSALRGGALETVAELPGVRYVWDVLVQGDAFILATGVEGQVLRVTEGGQPQVLLDAEQVNVLSLAQNSDGVIYAGTDTDGLIYRITPNGDEGAAETFVVYDADEPEIGALLVRNGIVYAGTADAAQARPGRLEDAAAEEAGRPADAQAPEPVEGEGEPEEGPVEPEVPNVPPAPEPMDDAEADDDAPAEDAEPVEASNEAAAPTSEEYDALRKMLRKQLEMARDTGKLQVEGMAGPAGAAAAVASQRARPQRAAPEKKEGNAVYRIDPDGFVREVFRESVMILKLAADDGHLIVLTGNEGQVYRVDPQHDETTVLIDLPNEQLVAALPAGDGVVLIGGANPAELIQLDDRFAPTGAYTSTVLDAGQVSLLGTLSLTAVMPDDSSVTVETRSGNTSDPAVAAWSPWSDAQVFMPDDDLPDLQPRRMKITSPPARFFQYRLTLSGNVDDSPAVERVEATYVTPNLRPSITSLTAAYGEAEEDEPPATEMNIEWESADPNADPLMYKLEYRPAGSDRYLLLAEDVTETRYAWQTRQVPDGRYVVRVTADDRPANPGDMAKTNTRVSDPVLVDNTAPTLEADFQLDGGTLTITGEATDEYAPIRGLAYSLDGEAEYTPILPDDLIFDSTSEAFTVTIPDLAAGPHVVTLRGSDARGNTAYRSVFVR